MRETGTVLPYILTLKKHNIMIAPHVLYSKQLHLLAHVLAMAHTGDPASVCKAIGDLGEEVLAFRQTFHISTNSQEVQRSIA